MHSNLGRGSINGRFTPQVKNIRDGEEDKEVVTCRTGEVWAANLLLAEGRVESLS
jgi:hypothetical protein